MEGFASVRLTRDPGAGVLAGVCAGLARRFGIDAWLIRAAFIVATAAGGFGLPLYLLGWVAMPASTEGGIATPRRDPRASVLMALGAGLLVLSALLTLRALGLLFSDAIVWPLVLVGTGGALLWRQGGNAPALVEHQVPPASAPATSSRTARAAFVSRTSLGVALVLAAGLVFLDLTGALSTARDVVLAVLVVVVVLAAIFAPWIVRLARTAAAERSERVRSQERAEMAAHLHDSVLQTLAMMQKRAEDPREVATLARRQERELRTWLSGRGADTPGARLAAALEEVAEEVEAAYGVPVEVVAVGEFEMDDKARALVAAAREAMTNAAKFGGGTPVSVYAEAGADGASVFVRDRGPGFDLGTVPEDRRGVRESIVGRMERHGGSARITCEPGSGTEVELVITR